MEIKICGITNIEDASLAVTLGVDALGFNFYPKTTRYCTPETAKSIIDGLGNTRPVIVGIFVNDDAARVREAAAFCGLDVIQLHGDESPHYCRLFPGLRLIKSLTPEMESDTKLLDSYPVQAILVDARDAERYGGTGKTSDWDTARKIALHRPLILAGGLNENNIRDAIAAVSPHAVDINSGIESSPGKKDAEKMRRIMEIIRTMESPGFDKTLKIFSRK
jgi:phosphoribosylanthranilate isomerase